MPKATQKETKEMAYDYYEIEDETDLISEDLDSARVNDDQAPSSQKSEQSSQRKTRYKTIARKNKNKTPIVPSTRVTRSQDVLLDESANEGQKEETADPAEVSTKKGVQRRISPRKSAAPTPIKQMAGAPSEYVQAPIRKMAGAPAEYVQAPIRKMVGAPAEKVVEQQGKKGGKKRPAGQLQKTSKVAGKRKAAAKKNVGKRKKIQEVPYDEPSQDPSDSGDDSEESVYKVEKEPVSKEDDELEDEEEEVEIKPKKKKAKKEEKVVKPKAEKKVQELVVYKLEGEDKKKKKAKTEIIEADEVEEIDEEQFQEEKASTRGGHVKLMQWIKQMSKE
ncbi:nucleolin-like isoform X2 [Chenopodium quinoa]|uniref:nucleolin-like isoform X2 n=1 Tax=Chenopodium quinoa TaxID=63459 RepID=UPI000B78AF7B|nr:nucleolin-like isoform X2 [Chenopodium quinoa]